MSHNMLADDVLMLKPPGPLADRNKVIAGKQGGHKLLEQLCDLAMLCYAVLCDAGKTQIGQWNTPMNYLPTA